MAAESVPMYQEDHGDERRGLDSCTDDLHAASGRHVFSVEKAARAPADAPLVGRMALYLLGVGLDVHPETAEAVHYGDDSFAVYVEATDRLGRARPVDGVVCFTRLGVDAPA